MSASSSEQVGSTGSPPEVFVAYSYSLYPREVYRKPFTNIELTFGVRFTFADEKITNQHILEKVAEMIRRARVAIFDISDWNPNVTLELGFAQGAGKDWYIAINPEKKGDAPADLRGLDRIEYRNFDELEVQLGKVITGRFPPKVEPDPLDTLGSRLLEVLKGGNTRDQSFLSKAIGADKRLTQFILNGLVGRGKVERVGWGRGTGYRLPPQPAEPTATSTRPPETAG